MLTTAFVGAFLGLITSVLFFLPEFNPLPANFLDVVTDFAALIWSFDYILPMSTITQIITAYLYIMVVIAGLNITLWLLKLTRVLKI